MWKHVDRLERINHWLEGQALTVAQSASPYFDGVILRENIRLPFLVTHQLFKHLQENPEYYRYHFLGEAHLVFDFQNSHQFRVYLHKPHADLHYDLISEQNFSSTLSGFG